MLAGSDITWTEDEKALAPGAAIVVPNPNLMELSIPEALPFRRVYFYIEAKATAGSNYFVHATLDFIKSNNLLARVPCSIGLNALSATYMVRCCARLGTVNVGPAGPDSLTLDLSKKFEGGDRSVILTPFRLAVSATAVRLGVNSVGIDGGGTIDNIKVWIGILSSLSGL